MKNLVNITNTYYESNLTETEEIVLAALLLVVFCASFFGNLGMIITLYKNDKMWNSTNMLIGNLAVSGLLVTVICMPFSIISVLNSGWPFKEGGICQLSACLNSELLLVTILTHTMISVDKYFYVVKPFSRAMTVKRSRYIIFLVWFVATVMSVGPILKIGKFAYNPTTLICGVGFPDNKTDSLYLVLLSIIGFVIPNIIMAHTYLNVFLAVRNHSRRLRSSSITSSDVMKLQKKLIATVFFSVLCFLVCWTPFCVMIIMATVVESPSDLPYGLGVASYWCGYLFYALNPIIICLMSARFGDGVMGIAVSLLKTFTRILVMCKRLCVCSSKSLDTSSDSTCYEVPAPSLTCNLMELHCINGAYEKESRTKLPLRQSNSSSSHGSAESAEKFTNGKFL